MNLYIDIWVWYGFLFCIAALVMVHNPHKRFPILSACNMIGHYNYLCQYTIIHIIIIIMAYQ